MVSIESVVSGLSQCVVNSLSSSVFTVYSGCAVETHSGFMFDKGCGVLEEESDLYCIRSTTSGNGFRLEIFAGDFNVLMF